VAALERTLPLYRRLPDPIRDMLARRVRELTGLGLLGLTLAVAVALATWSVQDPSLSHATSKPIRNLLGYPGAITSDLLMQIFGLGAVMLLLPIGIWGWRLLTHRHFDREALRLALWMLATVAAAGFASCWPHTVSWPLPSGLGGVTGDALVRFPLSLFGADGVLARLILGVGFGLVATAAFFFASGAGSREKPELDLGRFDEEDEEEEEEDEDDAPEQDSRRLISLGMIAHAALSLKARLVRLSSTAYARLVSSDRAPVRTEPFDRREPTLGPGPSIVPQPDDAYADADEVDESVDDEIEEDEDEAEDAPVAKAPRKRAVKTPAKKAASAFVLPPVTVLSAPKASDRKTLSDEVLQRNSKSLEAVLQDFGVRGEITNARPGPVVTLYELEPAPGIKSSRVIGLADDIARSMSAMAARVAVVAGRNAIGIELPNEHREKVYLRELLSAKENIESIAKLPLCLGKTIGGEPVIIDLARTPHMLIAGTTGSGKSVAINTMILSLVYRLRPDQCRLIMVDPKMLELSVYDGIPHLLTPVVTDPKKAVVALKWAVREMEERYKRMAKLGVRNIDGYNARLADAKAKGEELTRTVHTGFDKETGKAIYEEEKLDLEPLPFIVIIVDEMADLMMVAGKDIEGAVQRLAQMARAAGLHVILATQRPSVDVITGTIKANFPTRISFQVTSKIDSRTILGEMGAEQLLGQGDMLYMAGGGRISRVHGPFVSDEEVEKVVRHLKTQGSPDYLEAVTAEEEPEEDAAVFDATGMGGGEADLFSQAVAIVKRDRKASTSYIQRRLQIGYNRAASLMERMEQEGIVGQANHAGKREILIGEDEDRH
jgi:S-DNA-T family DNA segregation ATPase FtsK/SpoIIIE